MCVSRTQTQKFDFFPLFKTQNRTEGHKLPRNEQCRSVSVCCAKRIKIGEQTFQDRAGHRLTKKQKKFEKYQCSTLEKRREEIKNTKFV